MEDNYTLHVGRNLLVTNDLFLRRAQIEWLVMGVILWSPEGELLDINSAAKRILAEHETSFMKMVKQPAWKKLFQEALNGKQSGWSTFLLEEKGVQLNMCLLPLFNFENLLVGVITYLYPPGMRLDTYPKVADQTLNYKYASSNYQRYMSIVEACAKDTHEIRNMLTTVRGYLQLFEKNIDEQTRKYLSLAMSELDHAVRLSQQLLEKMRQTHQRKHTSLNEIFHDLELLIRQKALLKDVQISFVIDGNNLTVSSDKDKLKQVLMNLVQNSIEAIPISGRVYVWAGKADKNVQTQQDQIVIFVCDDGPGIPMEVQKQAFDAFFTTKSSGTGLGLPISKQLVMECGGDLQLADHSDLPPEVADLQFTGAIFKLSLNSE